jgi:hypothetical protein
MILKDTRKERKQEIEKQLLVHMSTFLNNEIHEVDFFSRIFRACPPVHTFCKYFKGYKKERKHEIDRQLLVHMSTLSNNDR